MCPVLVIDLDRRLNARRVLSVKNEDGYFRGLKADCMKKKKKKEPWDLAYRTF